jgi:hypothetical protein
VEKYVYAGVDMKFTKCISIVLIAFVSIMGCSGKSGKIKTQSKSESKITQQELIDNWSDYTIWLKSAAVVFDPKNDDRTILLSSHWGTVKDQETWTEIVKTNTTSDGKISPVWANYSMTRVREIWGPDNQLYGFIIHQQKDLVNVRLVEENTLRLWYNRARFGGP